MPPPSIPFSGKNLVYRSRGGEQSVKTAVARHEVVTEEWEWRGTVPPERNSAVSVVAIRFQAYLAELAPAGRASSVRFNPLPMGQRMPTGIAAISMLPNRYVTSFI